MLAVDWLGSVLTVLGLSLLLSGRWRLLRSAAAVLMGEVGRVALALVLRGEVAAMTVGGVYTRLSPGPADTAVQIGGLWAAVVLGLFAGRRSLKDALVYAAGSSILIWLRSH